MARVAVQTKSTDSAYFESSALLGALGVLQQLDFKIDKRYESSLPHCSLPHWNRIAHLEIFATGGAKLYATDLKRWVVIDLPCISAHRFSALVHLGPDTLKAIRAQKRDQNGNVEFQLDYSSFFLSNTPIPANCLCQIENLTVEEFEQPVFWPQKQSVSDIEAINSSTLLKALDATSKSIRLPYEGNLDSVLHGLHVKKEKDGLVRFESTDGYRASMFYAEAKISREMLIPFSLVEMINAFRPIIAPNRDVIFSVRGDNNFLTQRDLACFFRIDTGWVKLVGTFDLDVGWEKDARIYGYPNFNAVTPKKRTCSNFKFFPRTLDSIVSSAISSAKMRRPRKELLDGEFSVFFEAKDSNVFVHHPKSCTTHILCAFEGSERNKHFKTGFNPFYVLDAIRSFDVDTQVKAWLEPDGLGPLHLVGDGTEILLMPMRV